MARIVHLACANCGHPEMYVVESAENDEVVAEIVRSSSGRVTPDDSLTSAEARQRRLESLPRSLPVGGIITPV